MINRELLRSWTWERYPHLRKYFAVVHADFTRTHARDVGKWLLIAPLIGLLTGAVIVVEIVVILQGISTHLLPLYYLHHWLMFPGILVGFGTTGLIMRYRDPDEHSADEVIRSYHEHHGDIDLRSHWPKLMASAATIGFGGRVALEGPNIYAGARVGSWLWKRLRRSKLLAGRIGS